jgi:hypothetical protein
MYYTSTDSRVVRIATEYCVARDCRAAGAAIPYIDVCCKLYEHLSADDRAGTADTPPPTATHAHPPTWPARLSLWLELWRARPPRHHTTINGELLLPHRREGTRPTRATTGVRRGAPETERARGPSGEREQTETSHTKSPTRSEHATAQKGTPDRAESQHSHTQDEQDERAKMSK